MISCDIERKWSSNWISAGFCLNNWQAPARPAPYFRRAFEWDGRGEAVVYLCGLGYYELYLNGEKVGDHVLDPVVTQYDRRARYVKYDLSSRLRKGANTFGVILGSGWYNLLTSEVWHFDKVSWNDYPKLILELEIDGKVALRTDESWKCLREAGPITFTQLRNGEFYDARKEIPGWSENSFDDSAWEKAKIIPGPGGVLTEQVMPPCRVTRTLRPARELKSRSGGIIYDIGQPVAGWARIRVRGERGAVVRLRYSELINDGEDDIDQSNISSFILSGETQTDRYTLKGGDEEVWEPRFVYHGFNFVEAAVEEGTAEIVALEARVVSTGFTSIGSFESSNRELTTLFEYTRRSFVGNFVGIPTDCPHREKNGWTGDASLASETGLFNFDLASPYAEWIQTIADVQRPNGQLPGIIPSGGWGFNWGSGPVWDSAFILIPYNVYLYTGDRSIIERNYGQMRQYIRFLETLADNRIIEFGLGDWCHYDHSRIVDTKVTSTAYSYCETVTVAKCAELLGRDGDAAELRALAAEIREAFNKAFYHGGGTYAKGEPTALALALEFGLCPEKERSAVAAKLAGHMENRRCRADFGIVGAKFVPRALAANGYADTACRILTQPDFPGWVHWLSRGATGLWENWDGQASRNHIMFGDIAAWMMQYLAGIVPDEKHPGFSEVTLRPLPAAGVDRVKASHRAPSGQISVEWERDGGEFRLTARIGDGVPGRVELPDGSSRTLAAGENRFECGLPSGANK